MTEVTNKAIEAYGLTKSYSETSGRGALDFLGGRRQGTAAGSAAIEDVDVTLGRGETLGIVGRNGAGKSTLLKVLAGITAPDAGTVSVQGQLVAVIGPVAGMKPDLTGRENILVRGAALGMDEDAVRAQLDDIVTFADLGHYIDRPMRTYSAGMKNRLGFATSFAFDPDILLVDESLAGGDDAFRRKVMARVSEIQERGASIILVSHAANMVVQFCDRALLLEQGRKLGEGAPKKVVDAYQKLTLGSPSTDADVVTEVSNELDGNHEGDAQQVPGGQAKASPSAAADGRSRSPRDLVGIVRPGTRWSALWVSCFVDSVDIAKAGHDKDGPDSGWPRFRLDARVKVAQSVAGLTGEAVIKSAEGIEAAVVRLDDDRTTNAGLCAPGWYTLTGIFVNRLQPGRYTVDVSVTALCGGEHLRAHHVRDAVEFECVGGGGAEVRGIVDLTEDAAETASESAGAPTGTGDGP